MADEKPIDREELQRLIPEHLLKASAEFVQSELWRAFKDCLMKRCPPEADVEDQSHVASQKAFKNSGWRAAISEIELLPFEKRPDVAPLIPETLLDPND